MLEALREAFSKEIAHNPDNIYGEAMGQSFVDFELANLHLETVIKSTLQKFNSP